MLATDILTGYFAEQVRKGYDIDRKHAREYRNIDIPPELFPRMVGEIIKRALLLRFKNSDKSLSSELEYLPEWAEEAVAVLAEEPPEEEPRKMYIQLLLKADDILKK